MIVTNAAGPTTGRPGNGLLMAPPPCTKPGQKGKRGTVGAGKNGLRLGDDVSVSTLRPKGKKGTAPRATGTALLRLREEGRFTGPAVRGKKAGR